MEPGPRFEFTFSYWIFAWFLVYYFGFTKYNPKIWLIIGLALGILGDIIMSLIHADFINLHFLIQFIIINVFLKAIPIYILRNTRIKMKDFIAGIALLCIFFVWVYIRLGSVSEIFNYINDLIKLKRQDKPSTPLINYLYNQHK